MPVSIQWESIYVTGIQAMDDQHRHFVDLINQMSAYTDAEIRSEKGRRLVLGILDYAGVHFAAEEALMRQHHYPDIDAHIKEHRVLTEAAATKTVALAAGNEPRAAMVMFLWNWLVSHTNLEDKALGKFLVEQGVK
jgi:hemerythrin